MVVSLRDSGDFDCRFLPAKTFARERFTNRSPRPPYPSIVEVIITREIYDKPKPPNSIILVLVTMPMAKKYRDEVNEFGLEDHHNGDGEEEEEDHSLIELSSIERSRRAPSRPLGGLESSSVFASSRACRWSIVLFLVLLVGVYHLGLEEGKNEVMNESGGDDIETKQHSSIIVEAEEGQEPDDVESQDQPTDAEVVATPQTKPAGLFTLDHLHATRGEATKIVTLLDEYYFGKDQAKRMLMDAWLGEWDFDAPIDDAAMETTRVRAAKLVDTMARALVTDNQKTFLMGGIGSSVMAGHDNCHYDSYQTQMERMWSPVWKAANMDFIFQNAGEGGGCGDSHHNQHFCVKQNISPEVDIVHYSWTYFEGRHAQTEHEDLVRWSQMLPKQPLVHILNAGLPDGSDHPYSQLTEYYAKYGLNSYYMTQALNNGGHDYEAERNDPDNPINRLGAGVPGDGYHNTTRYGELEDNEERKQSLGVVFRNWVSRSNTCSVLLSLWYVTN